MDALPPAGLCDACRHLKRLASSRGSTFYLCLLSEQNAAFPRYPRLPVLRCGGFEKAEKADEGQRPGAM